MINFVSLKSIDNRCSIYYFVITKLDFSQIEYFNSLQKPSVYLMVDSFLYKWLKSS